jgi:glutathione synthase/RimK-type ligase-like ATP-grasp enzyme
MSLGGISTNVSFSSDLFGDCIKAAELLWLPWAGIDIIAKDDSFSDYSIIEVNSQPDFKMHMYPSYWEPIDIASMLMDLIEKHYV